MKPLEVSRDALRAEITYDTFVAHSALLYSSYTDGLWGMTRNYLQVDSYPGTGPSLPPRGQTNTDRRAQSRYIAGTRGGKLAPTMPP